MQLCSIGTVVLNPIANKDVVWVIIFIGDTTISDVGRSITLVNCHWVHRTGTWSITMVLHYYFDVYIMQAY